MHPRERAQCHPCDCPSVVHQRITATCKSLGACPLTARVTFENNSSHVAQVMSTQEGFQAKGLPSPNWDHVLGWSFRRHGGASPRAARAPVHRGAEGHSTTAAQAPLGGSQGFTAWPHSSGHCRMHPNMHPCTLLKPEKDAWTFNVLAHEQSRA